MQAADDARRPLSQIVMAFAIAVIMLSLMGFVGNPEYPKDNRVKVVVTILPQAEFAYAVGGGHVNVTVMVPPGQEPHTYSPKPSQMRELERADLYFELGSGIEFELVWMSKFTGLNTRMLVVDGAKGLTMIDSDPHTWMSPRNVEAMVERLEHGLEQVDPANTSDYRLNMNAYLKRLDALDANISAALAPLTDRNLLVLHPAWAYFARDYGLNQTSIEFNGKEPTTQYFARVIDFAVANHIKVIFAEPQFSTRTADELASAIGGVVVLIDDLAEDYIDNLDAAVHTIVQGLS